MDEDIKSWVHNKIITLTLDHKLILSSKISSCSIDRVYSLDNFTISIINDEDIKAICINFLSEQNKLIFTSATDDLLIDRYHY
ncbi:hypothetical protein HZS_6655 [Henneguya salminicola]|nr:hypothetical protein HZS_6655 [Henneguya salminicola]